MASLALRMSLALVCLTGALTGAPAWAGTRYVDGISDQGLANWAGTYSDGLVSASSFPGFITGVWLGGGGPSRIDLARFVVPWDVMADTSDDRLYHAALDAWYRKVTALGLTPDVALDAGAPGRYGSVELGALPRGSAQYARYVSALLAAHPGVRYVEAWNEPNAEGLRPAAAARLWSVADGLCHVSPDDCTAIAGDFLDADAGMVSYETAYEHALAPGVDPGNWGIHPYYAVNHYPDHGLPYPPPGSTTVDAFRNALPHGSADSVWFTEVGAYYCQIPRPGIAGAVYGTATQAAAASYLVNTLMPDVGPVHVFYYELAYGYGLQTPCLSRDERGRTYTDSALYAPSEPGVPESPRPAAATVLGGVLGGARSWRWPGAGGPLIEGAP